MYLQEYELIDVLCYTVNMKRKILIISLLALAVLIYWFFYPLRSYVVMSVYSGQHSRESVSVEHGFSIDIPSGSGWYPFVLTYNADGFASWSGINADMSILYNFGAFDAGTRTSSIYDAQSNKYCAFYGAYVVHMDGGVFGFTDDSEVDMDEVISAVKYDYTQLVLKGFGCNQIVFETDGYNLQPDMTCADSDGWTCVDAKIATNGVAHNYVDSKTAYLQYGPPTKKVDEDFIETTLYGRLYIKYLEQYDCTVMVYVIAPDETAVDVCDEQILSQTKIAGLQE